MLASSTQANTLIEAEDRADLPAAHEQRADIVRAHFVGDPGIARAADERFADAAHDFRDDDGDEERRQAGDDVAHADQERRR